MKDVIFYGAGEFGRQLYGFLKYKGYTGLRCFADKKAQNIKLVDGIRVVDIPTALKMNIPILITVRDINAKCVIKKELESHGALIYDDVTTWVTDSGLDASEWHRDYVSYVHIDDMLSYYNNAEADANMDIFWGDTSIFRKMFDKLDLAKVVELACGHGRHLSKYLDRANNIILVDVLKENVEFCKRRYSGISKIKYYVNNGKDLSDINNNSCTSVFSYDAMVHFEMMDIYSYLKDIYRILEKDGYALLHHSNRSDDPLVEAFETSIHSRSFMSKNLFAYLAHRCGFIIVDQQIIEWGGVESLDCITLIQKK